MQLIGSIKHKNTSANIPTVKTEQNITCTVFLTWWLFVAYKNDIVFESERFML